ncbi:MAG: hypothetical protein VXW71_08745 [Actinomycetota bacterium]|nr:hypothetical protein [Actinomycetota bacterium]
MIDYEKADLAVVKALSRSSLTIEEVEQLLDADRKYYTVDQGLDHVQTQDVKKWAKSEAQRIRAQYATQAKNLEELEEAAKTGMLSLALLTEDEGRLFDYGEVKSDSDEGRMAKEDLFRMSEYSSKLHDLLHDDDDLPEWCLKYIYLSSAALAKVYHYLEYKMFRQDPGQE